MKTKIQIADPHTRLLSLADLEQGLLYRDGAGDNFMVIDGMNNGRRPAIVLGGDQSGQSGPFSYNVDEGDGPFSALPAGSTITITQE